MSEDSHGQHDDVAEVNVPWYMVVIYECVIREEYTGGSSYSWKVSKEYNE